MPCLAHASEPCVVNALNRSPYTAISRQKVVGKSARDNPNRYCGCSIVTRGGTLHIKGVGMLVGNFELNP